MSAQDVPVGPHVLPHAPFRPSVVGQLVVDLKSNRLVRYMGEWCGLMWVRPLGGGTEVPVHPGGLAPAPAPAVDGTNPS
ncbi:hypothetical protein GCM10009759_23850 [Kitasatospora saccharophila]|uniref:Uncharacterized protein n=1 Tax=Kitasatospora saccharophila TaxID=407973 RepID=A0ABN2WML8_9ACTN